MNKLTIVFALCAALSACKKEGAAPAAAATSGDAAPATAATSDANLPAACEEYFKRAEACFVKAGGAAGALKTAFEQSRAQMAAAPAAQMEMGCKAANDAFAQTAAALKCE